MVMKMDIFEKYPQLKEVLEMLCQTRRDEILADMVRVDMDYMKLCKDRADTSIALQKSLDGINKGALLEAYSDAVYAQEVYELDTIYRQALYDMLCVLQNEGLI